MADSPARGRARRLLAGGLLGGGIAAAVAVVGCWAFAGTSAVPAAVVAATVTLVFFLLGQWVQVLLADAPPAQVMVASLVSYAIRVGGLGVLLVSVLSSPARAAWLLALPLVVTTIAVVIGWVAGEIVAFSRLRIPVFDSTEGN